MHLQIRNVIRALVAGVILASSVTSLPAQKNKDKADVNERVVDGAVIDADKVPVPEAIVQLKDTKTLVIRTFRTQPDGSFHFAGLRTDTDYELKAIRGDQTTDTKRISWFDTRKAPRIVLQFPKEKK